MRVGEWLDDSSIASCVRLKLFFVSCCL